MKNEEMEKIFPSDSFITFPFFIFFCFNFFQSGWLLNGCFKHRINGEKFQIDFWIFFFEGFDEVQRERERENRGEV